MDEYLFYQQNKKMIPVTSKGASFSPPKNTQCKCEFKKDVSTALAAPVAKVTPKEKMEMLNLPVNELTQDTMKDSLIGLSGVYQEQYANAGFPPRICTLMLKDICESNRLKVKILDVGCGKGHVGEYLKKDGFQHIHGIDCSKSLLEAAQEKNIYKSLDKVAFGEVEAPKTHNDKYDFVVSASMINNDGWDEGIFHTLLDYTKMGGFLIFATKLTLSEDDHYKSEIEKLAEQKYWKFVTEHTFFRYDKLCMGQGKFSNKKVKIVCYQKTDHEVWLKETEAQRAEEQRIADEKQALIDKRNAINE